MNLSLLSKITNKLLARGLTAEEITARLSYFKKVTDRLPRDIK
jgi:hypothetical protein